MVVLEEWSRGLLTRKDTEKILAPMFSMSLLQNRFCQTIIFLHSFIDGNNYRYYTNFRIISCWIVALYYLFSFFYSVELAQRPVVVYERQHRNETKILLESIFGKCFSHICLSCLISVLNCRYFHSFQFKMETLLNHQIEEPLDHYFWIVCSFTWSHDCIM